VQRAQIFPSRLLSRLYHLLTRQAVRRRGGLCRVPGASARLASPSNRPRPNNEPVHQNCLAAKIAGERTLDDLATGQKISYRTLQNPYFQAYVHRGSRHRGSMKRNKSRATLLIRGEILADQPRSDLNSETWTDSCGSRSSIRFEWLGVQDTPFASVVGSRTSPYAAASGPFPAKKSESYGLTQIALGFDS
jgi:hypothetical protein